MRLSLPIVLGPLLLVFACKGDDSDSTTQPETTTTSAETTADTPTTSIIDPSTTTTGTSPTSTGDTTGGSSTTGEPIGACIEYTQENDCKLDERCKWASVFTYTHGATGCQGDITELCTDKTAGAPSTWYRGENGDYQVVGFDYVPTDLPPEWKECDCDGPLACFCAFNAPECPDRLGEFCGATTTDLACSSAVINGEFACGWFKIAPNGPIDGECTTQPSKFECLPADNAGSNECTKISYTYDGCGAAINPAFWREVDGVFEVTASCGPTPMAPEWTPCVEPPAMGQPDDCACACFDFPA